MKYFVIFLTVIAIFIITTNPAYAICAYDPSQPHKPCDDSPGTLIIEPHQAQIENIEGKLFRVIGPFTLQAQSNDTIRLGTVEFSYPYFPVPHIPGGVQSVNISFKDGIKENIGTVGPPTPFLEFTEHNNPKAGVRRNSDGTFNFLLSIENQSISPLTQFEVGIPFDEIQCKDSLVLIQKYDGSPACVKPETVPKLIERVWTKQDSQKTETSTLDPESNQYPTIVFPQNATGSSPDSGPIPHVTVVSLGINDTISWINESDRTIVIRAYDKSWNAGEILPHNQIDVKFNHTGQYEYLIDILEDNRRAQGEIIVLGNDIDSIPIEERLKMAQAILGQHFRTLPIVSIGAGNADKVLDVTIHEDELEKFTDAHAYYKTKVQEIIPFDIPIKIDFGQYIHAELQN